jgi:hypothetical protein
MPFTNSYWPGASIAISKPKSTVIVGTNMSFIDVLIMLMRWKNTGWEVHPINLSDEFHGWI